MDAGEVLAYPTEAMYGLGCDPWNICALENLLKLKVRSQNKGLIVLIYDWSQLWDLIAHVPDSCLERVHSTWPGPVTWIFPKSEKVPRLLCGDRDTIAIRMTAHKVAHDLCFNAPIVSTSANITGSTPARSIQELQVQFPTQIKFVLDGALGSGTAPSSIFDVMTCMQLR